MRDLFSRSHLPLAREAFSAMTMTVMSDDLPAAPIASEPKPKAPARRRTPAAATPAAAAAPSS